MTNISEKHDVGAEGRADHEAPLRELFDWRPTED
jgi:hypothetical protein